MEEEEEKAKLQNEIRTLTDRLAKVNESLTRKIASRAEFDRTITETEAAYTKACFAVASTYIFSVCQNSEVTVILST